MLLFGAAAPVGRDLTKSWYWDGDCSVSFAARETSLTGVDSGGLPGKLENPGSKAATEPEIWGAQQYSPMI
ncbi:hypothetical protein E4U55_007097 [Claviceps digitariae]|nr:hypothetical protein E4U55_007097 [Claviceps digitariae]